MKLAVSFKKKLREVWIFERERFLQVNPAEPSGHMMTVNNPEQPAVFTD